MRLWSLHPCYLDSKGLVALWRESLLAQSVLNGKTKGYRNHPQLNRFKSEDNSIDSISTYLLFIADEADKRGYNFNRKKIVGKNNNCRIPVTSGQFEYEFKHLLSKLKIRDLCLYQKINTVKEIIPHPIFFKINGGIEDWEVVH